MKIFRSKLLLLYFLVFYFISSGKIASAKTENPSPDAAGVARAYVGEISRLASSGSVARDFRNSSSSMLPLYVDGIHASDSFDCGSYPNNPCRSISFAVSLSNASFSTILVKSAA